jgi:hypothetical protein
MLSVQTIEFMVLALALVLLLIGCLIINPTWQIYRDQTPLTEMIVVVVSLLVTLTAISYWVVTLVEYS